MPLGPWESQTLVAFFTSNTQRQIWLHPPLYSFRLNTCPDHLLTILKAIFEEHFIMDESFKLINDDMVLASRASGCLFGHPNPEKAPLRTPKNLWQELLKMSISSKWLDFIISISFSWHCIRISCIILMNSKVYGWNLSILWPSLKIWMPKNFTIGNFGHRVSKPWLRPWFTVFSIEYECLDTVTLTCRSLNLSAEKCDGCFFVGDHSEDTVETETALILYLFMAKICDSIRQVIWKLRANDIYLKANQENN